MPETTTETTEQTNESQAPEGQQQGEQKLDGQQGGGLDSKSFAKLMKDVGAQSVQRELEKVFGTSDIEELKKLKEQVSQQPKKTEQLPDEVVKKIQELENKIREKDEAYSREIQRQRLTVALSKHAPKVPGIVLDYFEKEFEVKKLESGQEVVYKKGASLPEQIDNDIATVDKFFEFLATKSELSGLFDKRPAGGSHVDTAGSYVDEKNTPVTPEQLRDPAFIQAVEEAGEMSRLMASGKVDMSKVKGKLKK